MKSFCGLILAMILGPLALGLADLACYDTTVKTPPCSVNAHQEGCPPFPADMRAPDGGL